MARVHWRLSRIDARCRRDTSCFGKSSTEALQCPPKIVTVRAGVLGPGCCKFITLSVSIDYNCKVYLSILAFFHFTYTDAPSSQWISFCLQEKQNFMMWSVFITTLIVYNMCILCGTMTNLLAFLFIIMSGKCMSRHTKNIYNRCSYYLSRSKAKLFLLFWYSLFMSNW